MSTERRGSPSYDSYERIQAEREEDYRRDEERRRKEREQLRYERETRDAEREQRGVERETRRATPERALNGRDGGGGRYGRQGGGGGGGDEYYESYVLSLNDLLSPVANLSNTSLSYLK